MNARLEPDPETERAWLAVRLRSDPSPRHELARRFVEWSAERFHRDFEGGPWRWRFITDKLGVTLTDVERTALAEAGLRALGRDVRSLGGRRLFLMSIALSAGPPLRLIGRNRGGFRRCLEALTNDLTRIAQPTLEYATSRAAVHTADLPRTFRTEDFHAMLGSVAIEIAALRIRLPSGCPDPLAWLDAHDNRWRASAPTGLDDALLAALLRAPARDDSIREVTLRLCERRLRRGEDVWSEMLHIPETATLDPARVGLDAARGRLIPEGALAGASERLAILCEPSGGVLECRRIGGRGEIPLRLVQATRFGWYRDGRRLCPVIPPGGAALEENGAFAFFRAMDDPDAPGLLRYAGTGPVRTTDPAIYLATRGPVAAPDGGLALDEAGASDGGWRVWRVTGRGLLDCDGERIGVATATGDDATAALLARGETVADVDTPGGDAVYRGAPELFLAEDGVERRISPADIEWRAGRSGPWRNAAAIPPLGRVALRRIVRKAGASEHAEGMSLMVLPGDFVLKTRPCGPGEAEIMVRGLPAGWAVAVDAPGARAEQAGDAFRIVAEGAPPAYFNLVLTAPDRRAPVALCARTPRRDPAIIDPAGRIAPRDARLTVDALAGWRVVAPEAARDTELRISSSDASLKPVIRRLGAETALACFQEIFLEMLSASRPDASLRITVLTDGRDGARAGITRFSSSLAIVSEGVSVSNAPSPPGALRYANLRDPLVCVDAPATAAAVTPHPGDLREAGPWLVFSGGGEHLRPAVWRGADTGALPEEGTGFSEAIAGSIMLPTREERVDAFSAALGALLDAPASGDWLLLAAALDAGAPPSALDLVHAFARAPAALVALLLRGSRAQLEERLNLDQHSRLFWPASRLADWRRGAAVARAGLAQGCEGVPEILAMIDAELAEKARLVALLRPSLRAHAAAAAASSPPYPKPALEDLLERAARDMIHRNDDRKVQDYGLARASDAPDLIDKFAPFYRQVLTAPFAAARHACGHGGPDPLLLRRIRLFDDIWFDEALPLAVAWTGEDGT